MFAGALVLHAPLAIEAVPGGILDHQAAPDADAVDRIQSAWDSAGLIQQAQMAMIADSVFIGVYGIGCVLGGLYFLRSGLVILKGLGLLILIAGLVFLGSDYGETIAQLIQLISLRGDNGLAWLASTLQPIKVVSWIVTFLTILMALIWERYASA